MEHFSIYYLSAATLVCTISKAQLFEIEHITRRDEINIVKT